MLHAEPFCLACGAGNIPNVTKYLAEKGNPNVSWLGGASPLHVAMGAVKASVEVAKLLIQAGANLNARDNEECTPLHRAKSPECVLLLAGAGADMNAQNKDGQTLLHMACKGYNSWYTIVNALVQSGADVNAMDKDGTTPLHEAAQGITGDESLKIVRLLIKSGANVMARNKNGLTPLHYVRKIEHAKLLVQAGADIHARTKAGDTPLHEAFLDVAEFLIQGGAGVNITNKKGDTPLHTTRNSDVAKLLIEAGANVNATNQFGQTPLYLSGSSTLRTFAYGDCDLAAFLRTYKKVNKAMERLTVKPRDAGQKAGSENEEDDEEDAEDEEVNSEEEYSEGDEDDQDNSEEYGEEDSEGSEDDQPPAKPVPRQQAKQKQPEQKPVQKKPAQSPVQGTKQKGNVQAMGSSAISSKWVVTDEEGAKFVIATNKPLVLGRQQLPDQIDVPDTKVSRQHVEFLQLDDGSLVASALGGNPISIKHPGGKKESLHSDSESILLHNGDVVYLLNNQYPFVVSLCKAKQVPAAEKNTEKKLVVWYWAADGSKPNTIAWTRYDDDISAKLEEAMQKKQKTVKLDTTKYVDLVNMVQLRNDATGKRKIKRAVLD